MEQKQANAHEACRDHADRSNVCEYCGHVRCVECQPDRWPNLADGCCACRLRALSRWLTDKASQCREMPRLYGPGLAVSQTCRFPFWGITLKGSLKAGLTSLPAHLRIVLAGLTPRQGRIAVSHLA